MPRHQHIEDAGRRRFSLTLAGCLLMEIDAPTVRMMGLGRAVLVVMAMVGGRVGAVIAVPAIAGRVIMAVVMAAGKGRDCRGGQK